MKECKLKGDDLTNEKTWTAGILSVDSDIKIARSHFENFKSGAIMLQAKEGNSVKVEENQIMSCDLLPGVPRKRHPEARYKS